MNCATGIRTNINWETDWASTTYNANKLDKNNRTTTFLQQYQPTRHDRPKAQLQVITAPITPAQIPTSSVRGAEQADAPLRLVGGTTRTFPRADQSASQCPPRCSARHADGDCANQRRNERVKALSCE